MKSLSIRQPWAFAITHLGKRIENRSWAPTFRGRFLIHAAKGMSRAEYQHAAGFMVARGLATVAGLEALQQSILGSTPAAVLPEFAGLLRGGFVATARLIDVLEPARNTDAWSVPGQFGLVLADVEPIPFVPFRGSLGFFDVPDDIVAHAGVRA